MSTFLQRRQRLADTDSILLFLDIVWSDAGDTLRIVNDNRDWISNGNTYIGYPFRFSPPNDTAGESPRGAIEIENVGRGIAQDLERWLPGQTLDARLMLADRADPNTYIIDMPLPIMRVSCTASIARAEGGVDVLLRQQAVRLRYTPFVTPGVF